MDRRWNRKLYGTILICLLISVLMFTPSNEITYANEELLPAFPGAEGFGMYATGGRGGEVYEVTNLNDSGPGSFRDAVSQGDRTIVFRVSGNIELKSLLRINSSNLTIAGQTAPGDGVAITGHGVIITDADNIIMRYMRFRLGDESNAQLDTFYIGNSTNIIIDHCSFLWGVDEVISAYPNENLTIQWSLIGEGLGNSIHEKGFHGFGGIWGSSSSYHHNLIVHNSDRNPRFMSYYEPPYPNDKVIDFRNNVIYDWGSFTIHSGHGLDFNIVNNYYKWGNSTREDRKHLIFTGGDHSTAHIHGNFIEGSPEITSDNMLGLRTPGAGITFSDTEVVRSNEDPATTVTTHTAEQAYDLVLEKAGAVLPRRDAHEARIVSQVSQRTGRMIDSQREVGGYDVLEEGSAAPVDSDHDGMTDAWELLHGLDPNDASDRNGDLHGEGYTNLEYYLNSIVTSDINPEVSIISPAVNSLHNAGGSMTITAEASDSDGTIAKVEFYADDVKIGEATQAPYTYTWNNIPEGTYSLTARAVDDTGTATGTPAHSVHINREGLIAPWKAVDIGSVGIQGHSDITEDGVFTVKGAGSVSGTSDALHFLYQPLKGNGELIARVDAITHTNEQAKAGIMIRKQLKPFSRTAMIALDLNAQSFNPVFYARNNNWENIQVEEQTTAVKLPYWIRLTRLGDEIITFTSPDGTNWKQESKEKFVEGNAYIGLISDPSQEPTARLKYNTSRFSHVTFRELPALPSPPEGLEASRSASDVQLKWLPAEGAESYTIKRSLQQGGPYDTVGSSVYASYTDTSLEPGVNYFYVVNSINEHGESITSSEEVNGSLLGSDPVTYLFYENFEQYDELGAHPYNMTSRPSDDANGLVVSSVPETSVGNESSNAVEMYDYSTAQTVTTVPFEPQFGKFSAEVDFLLPVRTTPIRALKVTDSRGSRAYVEILVYSGIGCVETRPCFSYRASDGNYYALPENHAYTADQWHHLRAVVDVPNQTVDMFVDGQFSGTIPFYMPSGWAAPESLGALGANTASSGQTSVYWDNIKVGVFGLNGPELTTNLSASGIQLSWVPLDDAVSYNIYRLNSETNRYERIASGLNGTEYLDEEVTAGQTYSYVVAGVHAQTGEGEYSEPASAAP